MPAEKLVTNNDQFGAMLQEGLSFGTCKVLHAHIGAGCEELLENYPFEYMVHELMDNCAEKPSDDIEIGVSVVFDEPSDMYRLVVEDNVRYGADQLKKIMHNLKRRYSQNASKRTERTAGGGIGKSTLNCMLERWGGSLTHETTEDGRIVAVAQWQRKYFLNPIPSDGRQGGYIRYVKGN